MLKKRGAKIAYDLQLPMISVSLIVAEKYGMLYFITKFGFVHIYELTTNQQIFKTRISTQAIFVA
jgi:clathrin heavy chain